MANDGVDVTFDLALKFRQRLQEINDDRMKTQAKINMLSDHLQWMFAKTPKKPRETREQMDNKIAKLEYDRTTTSLTLSEEKYVLRQMDMIKKQKKLLEENNIHERAIQEKKNAISESRDFLRTVTAQIAELELALSKVELAKRLGCTTSELRTMVVDCPSDKIGHIIGKNGASLRQLEVRTGVQVDIDKVGSKIHLQGSASALEAAVELVENVTLAVEEEVILPAPIVGYLLSQRSAILNKIQLSNPNVHFDLSRSSSYLRLRGREENVLRAKEEVTNLGVDTSTRKLSSRETGLIVGKGGATVNKLVSDHDVSINVENDDARGSVLEIVGLSANVENALAEVEDILHMNAECESFILVQSMQRNMFLSKGGAVLKEIQTQVGSGKGGVLLIFEKKAREDGGRGGNNKEPTKLIIKTSRANMPIVLQQVQSKIEAHEKTVSTMTVDAAMIPAIIGKGGATINALRQEGLGAEIEVEKDSGIIRIQSEDDEVKRKVKEAIEKIVSENQVLFVDIEQNMIGLTFGEPGKVTRNRISEELGVWMGVDSSDSHVVLRGTKEKIQEAAVIVRDFISENYTSEFEVQPDDEPILFNGGSNNIMTKIEKEHGVIANFRKASHKVFVRGTQEKVDKAMAELMRFILGGDGFYVCKLKVPVSFIGIVIGKGGSNISRMEKENEGVLVDLLRSSGNLSIRGPEAAVKNCRSHVITLLATARITEFIPVNPEQHETLSKPEVMRRVTGDLGVQVFMTEESVKIRGLSTDVKDAKALIVELISGKYESIIDLEASQLTRVKKAVKGDNSHFDRIMQLSKATVALDVSTSAIVITGKRGNVKKAKIQTFNFLDFILSSEFARVKVARPLQRAVADAVCLAKIAADCGTSVVLDRELSCIQIRSVDADDVKRAEKLVNERIAECAKLNCVVRLDTCDSWLLPKLIGKGGSTVQAVQNETGCVVDIYKDELIVAIYGETEAAVIAAKASIHRTIEQARKECVFLDIPESAMSSFIGKSGANIKKLASENRVEIERVRRDPTKVRIHGDEASVLSAKQNITQWLTEWESHNVGITISLDKNTIPALLGKQGEVINAIQRETRCRIDVDRRAETASVRGGTKATREDAIRKIEQAINEEKEKAIAVKKEKEKEDNLRAVAQAEIVKQEKLKEVKTNPTPEEATKKRNNTNNVDASKPKDRTNEFATKPVGLSANIDDKSKHNGKGKKKKNSSAAQENEKPHTSTAATSLFQLLVSDEVVQERTNSRPVETEEDTVPVTTQKPYYKSRSGFSLRL